MLGEDLGREADGLVGLHAAIGPHFEGQLVIVRNLTHAGVDHGVVDLLDGGEDGVDRDHADGHIRILVLIRAHIAATLVDGQRHLQVGVLVEGSNVEIGVDELKLVVGNDVPGSHFSGALYIEYNGLRLLGIQLGGQGLEVQDDFAHVLGHAGDGGELMLDAFDLDAGNSYARQAAEQHTAQGIAQRVAKAALQRLDDELAIRAVGAQFHTVDARFFDFDHSVYPPVLSHLFEGGKQEINESSTRRSCSPAE